MRFARNAVLSVQVLAAHPLRAVLSAGGVAVGVAAVLLTTSLGEAAERRVLEKLRAMGTDLVVARAAPPRRIPGKELQAETAVLFPGDAEAIVEDCPSVARAAPAVVRPFRVRFDGRSAETSVLGIPAEGLAIRNVRIAEGRGFDEDEDRTAQRVAVVGPSVAEALFAGSDPIGRRLQVGRVPFEVVGVAARRGLDAEGSDQDDVVIVPLGAALRRLLNQTHVHAIYVQAKGSGAVAQAELEVRELLRSRRRSAAREDAVRVQDPARLLATERRAAQALSRWIAAGSAAALAVGGVGVMAVMLLSLRERTREVGLRRALGARRRDVLAEFLFESSLLSAAGGLAGLLLGAGATALLGRLPGWAASFSWPAAAAGLGFSIAVGLVFGLFPALRASRLEPIAALRGE